jgi:hypothetical protein
MGVFSMRETFVLELGHAGLYTEDGQTVRNYVHRSSPLEVAVLHRSSKRRWHGKHVPPGNYVELADEYGFKYYILDVPLPPITFLQGREVPKYNGLEPQTPLTILQMGVNPASFWGNDFVLKHGGKWLLYHDHNYYTMLNVKEGVSV